MYEFDDDDGPPRRGKPQHDCSSCSRSWLPGGLWFDRGSPTARRPPTDRRSTPRRLRRRPPNRRPPSLRRPNRRPPSRRLPSRRPPIRQRRRPRPRPARRRPATDDHRPRPSHHCPTSSPVPVVVILDDERVAVTGAVPSLQAREDLLALSRPATSHPPRPSPTSSASTRTSRSVWASGSSTSTRRCSQRSRRRSSPTTPRSSIASWR